jgi:hypothetical protein
MFEQEVVRLVALERDAAPAGQCWDHMLLENGFGDDAADSTERKVRRSSNGAQDGFSGNAPSLFKRVQRQTLPKVPQHREAVCLTGIVDQPEDLL